jgi:serine/threonine protein kinase
MEYLPGGNLKEFIGSRRTLGKPFAEEEVARMMKIILEAVNCMHERHVLHRDLKPGEYFF